MSKLEDRVIHKAAEVANFMMNLYKIDPIRYTEGTKDEIPHGDLAYGTALVDWIKNGKPKSAWFSYDKSQTPCPLLMAFAKEIGDHFGLAILTWEEAELASNVHSNIRTIRVYDWLEAN